MVKTIPIVAPVADTPEQTDHAYGPSESIDRFDRALALWHAPVRTPDAEIIPFKPTMDSRTRDSVRTDAFIQGGVSIRQDNIVGNMFVLNSKPRTLYLFGAADPEWEKAFQEEVEEKWTLFAESELRWIDASRLNDFTSMIRMMVGIHLIGGEVLATAEWLRDSGRPYNTAIQLVECDRLSNPLGKIESSKLRGGVERNRFGAPQAYHIRMAHPASTDAAPDSWKWERVPVRKPAPTHRLMVLHIYDQFRPDQTRGLSEMIAGLKEMKITKKFRDTTLQNAIVNATYAATIESELPPDVAFQALGSGNVDATAITAYANAYLGAITKFGSAARNMQIDGIKIPHLYPGTKLQLRPAGTPGGVGSDFEASLLRYLASSLGVSYEQLSKDYSKTNYASGKLGENNTFKFMMAKKKSVADRAANSIFRLWLEEAWNKGDIEAMKRRNAPSWYDDMNADAYSACEWIGAGRGQVDELKETQAAVLRVNNNLSTLEDELGRNGKDWRKVLPQRERELREQEERDILAPESAAMNAATAAAEAEGDKPDGEGDDSGGNKNDRPKAESEVSDAVMEALVAAATRTPVPPTINIPEPPPVNVSVAPPQVDVHVHMQRNGKTETTVHEYDEKGRIKRFSASPVEEDEE